MYPTAVGIVIAFSSRVPEMAYRTQESAFHLTPAGWSTSDVPHRYRVESWRLSVYQESSAWSEMERDRLRQSFPPPAKTS